MKMNMLFRINEGSVKVPRLRRNRSPGHSDGPISGIEGAILGETNAFGVQVFRHGLGLNGSIMII
jgi:hypothetical protein